MATFGQTGTDRDQSWFVRHPVWSLLGGMAVAAGVIWVVRNVREEYDYEAAVRYHDRQMSDGCISAGECQPVAQMYLHGKRRDQARRTAKAEACDALRGGG